MSRNWRKSILAAILGITALANTGCFWMMAQGPNLGLLSIPIPVSPYFQKREEDQFIDHERYARAPILGPLQPGGPAIALDPPSDDEVRRKAAFRSCTSVTATTSAFTR
jgi:hypothetical protein